MTCDHKNHFFTFVQFSAVLTSHYNGSGCLSGPGRLPGPGCLSGPGRSQNIFPRGHLIGRLR